MAQPFAEPCAAGVIAAEPCPEGLGRAAAPARRRIVLAACVLASSMAFIDGSALTVALPRLRAHFAADFATVQWVLNGYTVALAALTLVGGAVADAFGKARILALSCIAFGIASVACALAPTAALLIAARVAQGVAAAVMTTASLALIGATYPKRIRGRAIGIWASASALTTAGGPVLGGWLTESIGWQAVFAINPPLAIVAAGLLAAFAPPEPREARRFDEVGAMILAAALALLALALSRIGAGKESAGVHGAGMALLAAAALGGFAAYAFWERASPHPMTPPRLLGNRGFVALNLATFLLYAGLSVMFFVTSFQLVDTRGLSATEAGLLFLPFTLAMGLLSTAAGAAAEKLGARAMLIGGTFGTALAFAWMAAGQGGSLVLSVIAPMTLLGIAFAAVVTPLTAAVIASLDPAEEGLASGVNNAVARIAQLAGVALAAGVATLPGGYALALGVAALAAAAAAMVVAARMPGAAERA